MRTHKPTLRVNGQLMIDIEVKFSISIDDIENIFLYGIYLEEEMPKNKTSSLQYIRRHIGMYGLSYMFDEVSEESLTLDMQRRATFLAKHFFPELVKR